MINFDDYVNENKSRHKKNWPYRILIIGGSGSGKTNLLLNLIESQSDIDKKLCMGKVHMKQNINTWLIKKKALA